MWGVNGFGSEAFGHIRIDVVAAPKPPVVAHLVCAEPSFALVGRDVVVAVIGREPAAIFLPTMRGPT